MYAPRQPSSHVRVTVNMNTLIYCVRIQDVPAVLLLTSTIHNNNKQSGNIINIPSSFVCCLHFNCSYYMETTEILRCFMHQCSTPTLLSWSVKTNMCINYMNKKVSCAFWGLALLMIIITSLTDMWKGNITHVYMYICPKQVTLEIKHVWHTHTCTEAFMHLCAPPSPHRHGLPHISHRTVHAQISSF